jgi:hypothetical protein
MISLEHIMHLKLDRDKLARCEQMPPPSHSIKALTNQFAAIGNATICSLLDVETDVFEMQLDAARHFGATYLFENRQRQIIGVSAATSLIKDDQITKKNLILPRDLTWKRPELSEHYILSVFVRGETVDGRIPEIADIAVAGWLPCSAIGRVKVQRMPPHFKSKLPVVMVPCKKLNPIGELLPKLTAQALHI